METRIEIKNGECILAVSGRIDTQNAERFSEVICDAITNYDVVKMDCTDLEYITSAGLRGMLTARNIAEGKGGKITLIAVKKDIVDFLKISGFDLVFDFEKF